MHGVGVDVERVDTSRDEAVDLGGEPLDGATLAAVDRDPRHHLGADLPRQPVPERIGSGSLHGGDRTGISHRWPRSTTADAGPPRDGRFRHRGPPADEPISARWETTTVRGAARGRPRRTRPANASHRPG